MQKYIKILFKGILGSLFCLFVLSSALQAQEKAPVDLKLIHDGKEGDHVLAGLILNIPQGWHVYAPSPQGEEGAGFEPSLLWENSKNLKEMKVLWPVAKKKDVQDQQSFVYEGKTVIPIELTPEREGEPIFLEIDASFLACSALCVPIEETISIEIDPNGTGTQIIKAIQERENAYEGFSLLTLLAIALLGGLILNIMPCVLPVLSLKIMSLVKQSKKAQIHHAKQGFLLTGLGILFSFLLLAIFTISLKYSGEAFGWGVHFQNPHFLLFVFLVLIAFSASLWGLFEIDLPSGMGTWLVGHEGKGKLKEFLSGVFATLLATPCSAPFVGTALSFALARDMSDIILVFFFLGLGFASPYFLVAYLPQRYIILPKPGAWMIWVQAVLGVGLGLTALWIGWILTFHLPLWVIAVSTLLALLALSFFWIKHHKKPTLKAWVFAMPLFLLAWALSWIAPDSSDSCNPYEKHAGSSPNMELWKPFQMEAIQSFVNQGKVVFVDATAEWCVTCAVNKSLVLNDPQITALLSHPDVIAMRADWTKQDPCITRFLHDHNRFGIPFNIVFGPKNSEGIVLPEILTVTDVKEAFEAVGAEIGNLPKP